MSTVGFLVLRCGVRVPGGPRKILHSSARSMMATRSKRTRAKVGNHRSRPWRSDTYAVAYGSSRSAWEFGASAAFARKIGATAWLSWLRATSWIVASWSDRRTVAVPWAVVRQPMWPVGGLRRSAGAGRSQIVPFAGPRRGRRRLWPIVKAVLEPCVAGMGELGEVWCVGAVVAKPSGERGERGGECVEGIGSGAGPGR